TAQGLKHYLAVLQPPTELNFGGWGIFDVDLKELAGLKQLRNLVLSERISDKGLKELAGLKQLRSLSGLSSGVTDAGLKELAGLKQLRMLDLWSTKVTDAGLKELAGLRLQSLGIPNSAQTDLGLKNYLAVVEPQAAMDLRWWNLSSKGVQELAAAKELQELFLPKGMTNKDLKHLAGLKQLWGLHLGDTQVTDDGLKELAGFKQLEVLSLLKGVTDAGLKHLAGSQFRQL